MHRFTYIFLWLKSTVHCRLRNLFLSTNQSTCVVVDEACTWYDISGAGWNIPLTAQPGSEY